jgi:hypothetical protein
MSEEHQLVRIAEATEESREILSEIRDIFNQFLDEWRRRNQGRMDLKFGQPTNSPALQTRKGETTMPGKETDTQTIPCSEMETDGQGNPVTLNPANVQWAIDDPTIATLTQNADGSATFKAVKPVPPAVNPRTANVSCTDTKTGVVGTDTLEVDDSPTQPGKMVLTFGSPA